MTDTTSSRFLCKRDVPEPFLLQHYCHTDVHVEPHEDILTGLMCLIDYSNKEPSTLQELLQAGMTIARLNMRGMNGDERTQTVQSIRLAVRNFSAELEHVYSLAIMVEVHRSSIVTGGLQTGPHTTLQIPALGIIRLTNNPKWIGCGTAECLYVNWDQLMDLKPDDIVYIDSLGTNEIKLHVEAIEQDYVICTVVVGGEIGDMMPVRAPHVPIKVDSENNEIAADGDKLQLENPQDQLYWAISSDIDAILIRDTRTSSHIFADRSKTNDLLLFASIETVQGVDNIDDILDLVDGIYLNRNILSTNLPVERIFVAQKMIAAKCRQLGKSFICETVWNEYNPSINATDIANLVTDGADVLSFQLRNENNKIQKAEIPLDVSPLTTAAVICRLAERTLWRPNSEVALFNSINNRTPTETICANAVELAAKANAAVMICLTRTGRTARMLAMGVPPCPVVAVTKVCRVARQMRFWRGLRSVHYCGVGQDLGWRCDVEARVQTAVDYCRKQDLMCTGDAYVVVMGSSMCANYCDSVRLLYASVCDTVLVTV